MTEEQNTNNDPGRAARIRSLNDQLRQTGRGGRVVVTAGIAALPAAEQAAIVAAVAAFDHFTDANDPYSEHDVGLLRVGSRTVMFKIDYFDSGLQFASPDPADPAVTHRVMSIMLAIEY